MQNKEGKHGRQIRKEKKTARGWRENRSSRREGGKEQGRGKGM